MPFPYWKIDYFVEEMLFLSTIHLRIRQNQQKSGGGWLGTLPNVHRRYTEGTPKVHPGSSVGSPQGALAALRWIRRATLNPESAWNPNLPAPSNCWMRHWCWLIAKCIFFSGEEKSLHFFSPDRGDCRSRKILQNTSLLAIVAVHRAENEPPNDLRNEKCTAVRCDFARYRSCP